MLKFKCSLCGNDDYIVRASNTQIRFGCYGHQKSIIECTGCRLVQLYPPWTDEEMECFYDKYSLKKDFINYRPKKNVRGYISKLIKGKKRILEIGCGRGYNLKYLREKGYNVIGIDKDLSVCDGKVILNCGFEDFSMDSEYDFIYAIHVFEHIKNTNLFINMLKRHLVNGGEFALEIPNVMDPLLSLYNNKAYQSFYWYPLHIYFYSPETIRMLFDKHNMQVEVSLIQRYGLLNHLRWVVFGKPGNWHPFIPVIDTLYKLWITKVIKVSDSILVRWKK